MSTLALAVLVGLWAPVPDGRRDEWYALPGVGFFWTGGPGADEAAFGGLSIEVSAALVSAHREGEFMVPWFGMYGDVRFGEERLQLGVGVEAGFGPLGFDVGPLIDREGVGGRVRGLLTAGVVSLFVGSEWVDGETAPMSGFLLKLPIGLGDEPPPKRRGKARRKRSR